MNALFLIPYQNYCGINLMCLELHYYIVLFDIVLFHALHRTVSPIASYFFTHCIVLFHILDRSASHILDRSVSHIAFIASYYTVSLYQPSLQVMREVAAKKMKSKLVMMMKWLVFYFAQICNSL